MNKLTQAVLFRVMNLDHHSGIISRDDEGRTVYTVENHQYPDQGDFAFSGDRGFDAAVTRAYPNHLGQVYAVRTNTESIIEPYPDDAPGLSYIQNGATVEAIPVPQEHIDRFIAGVNGNDIDPQPLQEEIIRTLFKD